jgi:hypothetical protein
LGHPCPFVEAPVNRQMFGSVHFCLNTRGRAALPVTKGFNFSPVALQQKRTLNLSLESFPPLHFSRFWIKIFSGHVSIK